MIRQYIRLDRNILLAITAEFFIQLVNSSFLFVQPLYMHKEGFTDGETADYISYRFLAVLLFAFSIGMYIRRNRIKPLFYFSAAGVPLLALVIIYSIRAHNIPLLYSSQFLWGVALAAMQTPILPYILRNLSIEHHTAAISLSYSTWSLSSIAGGILIWSLNSIDPVFFDERMLLLIISLISLTGMICVYKMNQPEVIIETIKEKQQTIDWALILKALAPTTILAIGAGFTIPFLSLFFLKVHTLTTAQNILWNFVASILVALSAMMVPFIKKKYGYLRAVPTTQTLAVIALIVMATTQYYSELNIAVYIAVIAFLLRQPLMNIAGPMTTDVVMDYVGKKNREIASGLTAAIWSGSWFISSRIFKHLRDSDHSYVSIFMITAAFYAVGIVWYYLLIREYTKRSRI